MTMTNEAKKQRRCRQCGNLSETIYMVRDLPMCVGCSEMELKAWNQAVKEVDESLGTRRTEPET
jgi:endogenous inhibitor of DNA gyrase (YacG/DUF329 family)